MSPHRLRLLIVACVAIAGAAALVFLRTTPVHPAPTVVSPESNLGPEPAPPMPAANVDADLAVPPPPPPPPPTIAAKPTPKKDASAARAMDEATLLATIDELGTSDLARSLALAQEGLARFPNSPNAPAFARNVAKNLVHLGRVEEARAEARRMLERYPGDPYTLEVERHVLRSPPNP